MTSIYAIFSILLAMCVFALALFSVFKMGYFFGYKASRKDILNDLISTEHRAPVVRSKNEKPAPQTEAQKVFKVISPYRLARERAFNKEMTEAL